MIKCKEEKVIFTATVISILVGFGLTIFILIIYHKISGWMYPAKEGIDEFRKWHIEKQSDRLMRRLKENYSCIVSTINNHEILEYLVEKEIFTISDRKEIEKCLGHRRKNQRLLNKLLQHGSKGYHEFMSALNQNDYYAELKSKIKGSKGSSPGKIEEQDDFNKKINENIRDGYESCVTDWSKDDQKFYVTIGTKKVEEILTEKNCVLVVGRSGNGKSAMIQHIALKLFNEDGYDIIPIVLDPITILQYRNPKRKQVFVIDDFCGKVVINPQHVQMWSLHMDDILKLIIKNQEHTDQTLGKGNVKLLFATVSDVFQDLLFNRINCLSKFKFLLSDQPLQDEEKIGMIEKYLTQEQMPDKVTISLRSNEDIYPLLCKLSVGKSTDQIIQLFTKPNDVITKDLLALEKTNKAQICLIALCTILENLKEDIFRKKHIPEEDSVVIEAVCSDFDLDLRKESTRSKLNDELKYLEKTYFVKAGESYQFVHKKIYDIAAVFCGGIISNIFIRFAQSSFIAERFSFMPTEEDDKDNLIFIHNEETQKMYFDRLMSDLEQGITYSTLHNSQLIHKPYRNKFCQYCRDRKQKIVEILNQLQKHASRQLEDTNGKTKATSRENDAEYEDYIEFSKSYHFSSHNMRIPLIESAWEGKADIVEMLVEMERDLNQIDKFGRSALFVACHLGKTNVAILLLNKGANYELSENNDISPIHTACKGGYSTITDALLNTGADIFKSDKNGCCALHAASETGHKKIVEKLLEANNNYKNIDQCDNNGRSSLFLASYNGKKKVVEVLIQKEANIDKCDNKGFSPLMAACTRGRYDVAEFLINKNADIFKTDNDRRSALYMACKKGHIKIVKLLLQNGADALQSDWHQRSPLFVASSLGHYQIVNLLVGKNCDRSRIVQSDEEGKSPLFIACEKGHESIVDVLLENGPLKVLEQTDKRQRTPLYVACRGGFIKIVETLVRKGAQIDNVNIWQATPLFAACREGHKDVVKYLVNSNADLNLVDSNGQTPLLVACDEGNDEIVRILVDNGCNINHQDNEDKTAFQIAEMRKHTDIINILDQQK